MRRYTTLWNSNVRKWATVAVINDKLQDTVVTDLRCGRIFNNQIKKGLLLNLPVIFLRRWIFGIGLVTGPKVNCVVYTFFDF